MIDEKDLTFRKIAKKYQRDKILMKAMMSPRGVSFDGMPKGLSASADSAMIRYEEAKDFVKIVDAVVEAIDEPSSTIVKLSLMAKSTTEIVSSISYSRDYYYHKLRPTAVAEFVDVCPVD